MTSPFPFSKSATVYRYPGLLGWLCGTVYQAGFDGDDRPSRFDDPNVYARTYRGVLRKLARRVGEQEPTGRFTPNRGRRQIIVGTVEFTVKDAT